MTTPPLDPPAAPEDGGPKFFGMVLGLWFWRRVLAYVVIVASLIGAGWVIWLIAHTDPANADRISALMWLGLALILNAFAVFTFYFASATVTQWAGLAAAAVPNMGISFGGVRAGPTPATPPPVEGD